LLASREHQQPIIAKMNAKSILCRPRILFPL
jgi:hypothetical protein